MSSNNACLRSWDVPYLNTFDKTDFFLSICSVLSSFAFGLEAGLASSNLGRVVSLSLIVEGFDCEKIGAEKRRDEKKKK